MPGSGRSRAARQWHDPGMGAWRNLGIYFGLVEPSDAERSAIESADSVSRPREFVTIVVTGLLVGGCYAAVSDVSVLRRSSR